MASTWATSGMNNSSHRTNSLAFAKHDCHSCAALKESCDRKRPRCGTCLSSRRRCGGFAMPLVWKDLEVAQTSPQRSDTGSHQRQGVGPQKNSQFKFIRGRPKKKRKPKTDELSEAVYNQGCFPVLAVAPGTANQNPLTFLESAHSTDILLNDGLAEVSDDTSDQIVDRFWDHTIDSNEPLPGLDATWTPVGQPGLSYNITWPEIEPIPASDFALVEFQSVEGSKEHDFEQQFSFTPMILYQNLAQKYSNILEMYNDEFCVIPLSHDCHINPFRVRKDRIQDSPFLLHAIMALSSQHLAKMDKSVVLAAEMHTHRSTAIQLFGEALGNPDFQPILDTLLILINLEITQSAYGMWSVHLNGARKLLEQIGAAERLQSNARMRAQVAMLVWWDVTIAFISRREPLLPISYLETLVEFDESDSWSFFVLNGCPIEFVMAMARLAKLASIYEKTTRMEWTIFNDSPVRSVVEEVKSFVNVEAVSFHDIEHLGSDTSAKRNRFHCIEAWRHAILLYALRVFSPKQDIYRMRGILHLARVILDSVRCIPQTEIIQKQLLLPIFLAGSEVETKWDRSFIRQYCKHWSDVSRFYHFESVAELLEDIWKDWDVSTRDEDWWGTEISQKIWNQDSNHSMVSEVLLG